MTAVLRTRTRARRAWTALRWTLGLLALAALSFAFLVRPWYLNWGATPAEIARALPGDELAPAARTVTTRALTVAAPPEKVWPWLVQVGYRRAGWYNLDWLNRLMGAADFVDGHRSADRIVPELQTLAVGQEIKIAPQAGFQVAQLEPGRVLGLLTVTDLDTGRAVDYRGPLPAKYLKNTMTVVLEPLDETTTRLIVRDRLEHNAKLSPLRSILGPGAFLQESRFMLGLKQRAES